LTRPTASSCSPSRIRNRARRRMRPRFRREQHRFSLAVQRRLGQAGVMPPGYMYPQD
jgi:hypothetical protein